MKNQGGRRVQVTVDVDERHVCHRGARLACAAPLPFFTLRRPRYSCKECKAKGTVRLEEGARHLQRLDRSSPSRSHGCRPERHARPGQAAIVSSAAARGAASSAPGPSPRFVAEKLTCHFFLLLPRGCRARVLFFSPFCAYVQPAQVHLQGAE